MFSVGGFVTEPSTHAGQQAAAQHRSALIATLPKAGTWYSSLFFWCYDQLLKQDTVGPEAAATIMPELEQALKNGKLPTRRHLGGTLGIDDFFLCHTVCPGFYRLNDSRMALWKALHFVSDSNNGGEEYIRDLGHWEALTPQLHPEARIVYLYRNPLDHFVSYFRHAQRHINPEHRNKLLPGGTWAPMETPRDMAMNGGLSGFIKHYYTFRQVRRAFPQQVLMVPYEQLTAAPAQTFQAILSFMGCAPQSDRERQCFDIALSLSDKSSVMALETRLGRALGADQKDASERHVRDGAVGKWRQHFSAADLKAVEATLNLFDISLAEFRLTEEGGNALDWLAGFDEISRQRSQIAFLERQLALSSFFAERQVQRLKSSAFWCLTAPLRAMRRVVRSRA